MKTQRMSLLVLLVGTMLVLSGCGVQFLNPNVVAGDKGPSDSAKAAIDEFHGLYNAQNFDALYDRVGGQLADGTSAEGFRIRMEDVQQALGRAESITIIAEDVISTNGTQPRTAVVVVNTAFDEGNGIEQFGFRFTDAGWQLTSYEIESPCCPKNNRR
jgi:hypothetical protein